MCVGQAVYTGYSAHGVSEEGISSSRAGTTGSRSHLEWVLGTKFKSSASSTCSSLLSHLFSPHFHLLYKAFVRSQFIPHEQNLQGEFYERQCKITLESSRTVSS